MSGAEDIFSNTSFEARLFDLCFLRPSNYFSLSNSEQWSIDRRIGIEDWKGGCYHEKEISNCPSCWKRFNDYFK